MSNKLTKIALAAEQMTMIIMATSYYINNIKEEL
jgi:hypothetical protein